MKKVGCFKGVFFGGSANNGSNAGFSYSNSNYTPSDTNANIGSQLYFQINNKTEQQPRLLAKHLIKKVLVGRPNVPIMKAKKMKRYNNLFSKIYELDNLRLADKIARRGKIRTYGVRLHDKNSEENLVRLQKALVEHTYTTSKYSTFIIREPKERLIFRLPYYPDRIVHHAIMNILEPIWLSIFTADTYSCIKGRGIHKAMKTVKESLKDTEGTRYCLKLDIKKFYPSINRDILKDIIRKKIKDKELLWLLDDIIDSSAGVPIGNYLSQYFANIYLAYFDHWLKEDKKVKYYFRYADDIVILGKDKDDLRVLFREIEKYLADNLNLYINRNWQIFPIAKNHHSKGRGLDFVGYVFYHDETRMRKGIKKNFYRKIAKLNRAAISAEAFRIAISPYLGWAKYSNSNNLLKKILKREVYEKIKLRHKTSRANAA